MFYSTVKDRYVICDKNRISRILLNLLSNAFKFTPSGGRIGVVLKQNGVENGKGNYEFSVADTGIGMSAHVAKPIEPAELFAAIAEVIKTSKE